MERIITQRSTLLQRMELSRLVVMSERNMFSTDSGEQPLPKSKLIHRHGNVPRLGKTPVGVAVVHWDEVHVAEHEAVVIIVLQGLLKANVEELGAIECGVSGLVQK